MHAHKNWMARAVALAGLTVAIAVAPAAAQTPEGTVITNTATVNWTDANANTYTPVNASVNVTVGFQAGLSLTPDGGSQGPASPSTGGTMVLTIQNVGNGTDQVQVAESITGDATVVSVTKYFWNAVDYGTDFAALNTALALFDLTAGASTVITVTYDVPGGKGGLSANYQLTATSVRDGGESNPGDYDITAGETFAVAVTPDGAQNLLHLPSNGTDYTFQYTVQNNGNGPEDFDLLASFEDASDIAIVSVNGVGGNSTQINLAASASTTIDVIYTVLGVAAGTKDTVTLRATSVTTPATWNEGFADLTVIRPSVTITKEAFTDAGLTTAVSGTVLPGQSIWYKVTVNNASGTAAATSIDLNDDLPTEVSYVTHGDDGTGWTISKLNGPPEHMDATRVSLAAGASAYFWIEVTIN